MEAHLPVCAHRMDDTDQQLQSDHKNPVAAHGNTPVHLFVVNDKQLKDGGGQCRDREGEKKMRRAHGKQCKYNNVFMITCGNLPILSLKLEYKTLHILSLASVSPLIL